MTVELLRSAGPFKGYKSYNNITVLHTFHNRLILMPGTCRNVHVVFYSFSTFYKSLSVSDVPSWCTSFRLEQNAPIQSITVNFLISTHFLLSLSTSTVSHLSGCWVFIFQFTVFRRALVAGGNLTVMIRYGNGFCKSLWGFRGLRDLWKVSRD